VEKVLCRSASVCHAVCVSAAALVSATKVMRCSQCSQVSFVLVIQGKTPLDSLLEYYRQSVDELSSDEAVQVKDAENLLRTKMRTGIRVFVEGDRLT